jgi:hypothetical protein
MNGVLLAAGQDGRDRGINLDKQFGVGHAAQ